MEILGTAIILALVGLTGVLAGMLFKTSVIDGMREDYMCRTRILWDSVERFGDECNALRARIYDLEQKLKDREDDGK